ncbi:MAG TPA: DUF1254 domain-containing protein [Bryobacteraceae bacterium]|nr:DUF1254 domain-containing protein [Bryobacteraceae bacterium]
MPTIVLCVLAVIGWRYAQSADPSIGVGTQEALATGTEAYIYGYPLVTMEMTRRVMTNVAVPTGEYAPMGQFALLREYPTAAFRDVTAPNADTLYSVAWLDLSHEPYIFSIPDAHGRYFLMPMLDAWTTVFQVPGTRTTGTKAQHYAITGPGWKGTLPARVTEYKSDTNLVWIIGRTYCTGTPEDYKKVHEFQDGLSLVPLSAYGKSYTPPRGHVDPNIDMKAAVRDQVNALDAEAYFTLMVDLMKNNPPTAADAPFVANMSRIGLGPGQHFDITKFDPATAAAFRKVPALAQEKIKASAATTGTIVNGWNIMLKTGVYGTDYLDRAVVTYFGLGANRPEDAVYPTSMTGADGKAYDGSNKYVMHFDKGKLPPVKGFWSLTMYNADFFFVENALNRYTLSQRNKLKFNADGSVDLYLQASNPGSGKESNWLPAPNGKFVLMLRLYWPNETSPTILDGTWKPPAVQQVN